MSIEKYISPFIQSHFPEFYKEYGTNFIAFTRAYYEWLESAGNPIEQSRKLYEYADIDSTVDTFIKYFKNKYMLSIPENIAADKRLLSKHILDLYKSKGSLRSYELLFRILFNEDIQVYIPGNDLFRLSNNKYIKPVYIEISDNQYLNDIIGKIIYDSSLLSTAVVENYFIKTVNNKTINVLTLSSVNGSFKYGSKIICYDLYVNNAGNKISQYEYNQLNEIEKTDYNLAITINNAPIITGSLLSVGIINGGSNFRVGDLLDVIGDGTGGIARVSTIGQDISGKVNFKLIDGGSGFTTNSTVTVTPVLGDTGTGATFKVGAIKDKEIINISSDIIANTTYNTTLVLDNSLVGCNLTISITSGTFAINDTITSIAATNVLPIDVTTLVDNSFANGESLSNSSLGISSLTAHIVDGNLIYVNGADILNANLTTGTILISNTTSSILKVNTLLPIQSEYGSGTINTISGSTILKITDPSYGFGYFVPGSSIKNQIDSTATVVSFTRNTNWPDFTNTTIGNKNLDTPISSVLTLINKEVGTIDYLSQINPGSNYSGYPTVVVNEQDIYDLKIPDKTGYKGRNAIVTTDIERTKNTINTVDIFDSGFGYSPGSQVQLVSTNTQNEAIVTGTAVVDRQGVGSGFFSNRSGFVSDTQYIIDSNYWQTQSYDIIATRMLSSYEKFVRDLVHPAGIALFGTLKIATEIQNEIAAPASFILQSTL